MSMRRCCDLRGRGRGARGMCTESCPIASGVSGQTRRGRQCGEDDARTRLAAERSGQELRGKPHARGRRAQLRGEPRGVFASKTTRSIRRQ